MKSKEAKNTPAERIASANAAIAEHTATAQRLRERLDSLALPEFDYAPVLAARAKVENLAASVALGNSGKAADLRAARQALAQEEAAQDAHAASTRELIEARAGIERMIGDADAALSAAGRERDEALSEWFAAELDAAERTYCDATVRAAAALRRCYALAEAAAAHGFTVKTETMLRVAEEFRAPVIGEHSAAMTDARPWIAGNVVGEPLRRISKREPGAAREALASEVSALLAAR